MENITGFLNNYGKLIRIEGQNVQNDIVCIKVSNVQSGIQPRIVLEIQVPFREHERCQKTVQAI